MRAQTSMSPNSVKTLGKRRISSERCEEQESTAMLVKKRVIVTLQQGGPLEGVVVP